MACRAALSVIVWGMSVCVVGVVACGELCLVREGAVMQIMRHVAAGVGNGVILPHKLLNAHGDALPGVLFEIHRVQRNGDLIRPQQSVRFRASRLIQGFEQDG